MLFKKLSNAVISTDLSNAVRSTDLISIQIEKSIFDIK